MIYDSHIPRDGLDQGPAGRERPQRVRRSAAAVCPQQLLEVGFSLCNKEEGSTTEIQHSLGVDLYQQLCILVQ